MTGKAHVWFIIAFIAMSLGTIFALTQQQANLDDHRRLDQRACELAHTNRQILHELVRTAVAEPATPPSIHDEYVKIDQQLVRLIAESGKCKT